jgi:HPt (histidine-containing phosphotransfer) domain-containing protein
MTELVHGGAACGDPAALERLRRFGGHVLVQEMIGIFLETVPARLASARAALERGDVASLKLAARMTGTSSGQLGAMAMRDLCARLEQRVGALDLEPVPALLDALEAELARVRGWLETVREALPGAA